MSLAGLLQSAATEAQSLIAEMQGMAPGAEGNVLIAGHTYTGVFGAADVVEVPVPGGGYRRRSQIPLTITREQFSAPPASKTTATRIDLIPSVTYTIDYVNDREPLIYTLTLVKLGA